MQPPAALEPAELEAWLRLSLAPGIGNDAARRLLAGFDSPQAIFAAGAASRWPAMVTSRQCDALAQKPPSLNALLQTTLQWLAAADADVNATHQHRCIAPLGHPAYPASLLEMADPPLMLYLMGSLAHTAWADNTLLLAIVGSRNPTPQGQSNAHAFAKAFGNAGWCIVSGLAAGVDGAAHEGALASGGNTIAVVGTGLDRVYPKKHLELARQIAAQGLLISEFPLGTPPLVGNFPKRNRIIAGLTRGTLVIEAALKSGSLITARLASEQGKEVFAIPGSIHSPQSRGCHALIKQGAKLVESASDIFDELPLLPPGLETKSAIAEKAPNADFLEAAPSDHPLLTALGYEAMGFDALQARTGIATPVLQAQLLELELYGHIARLPGGRFQRMAMG